MNGGYTMIDCTGVDLGNLGTVSGLYEKAKAAIATGKPLVLKGVKNSTQKFTDMVVYCPTGIKVNRIIFGSVQIRVITAIPHE